MPQSFPRWLALLVLSFCLGVANEMLANIFHYWIYQPWWLTFVNLIMMFVILMPTVAYYSQHRSLIQVFLFGFAVGACYEFADMFFLHWTQFPPAVYHLFHQQYLVRLFIAGLWGLVPVFLRIGLRPPTLRMIQNRL